MTNDKFVPENLINLDIDQTLIGSNGKTLVNVIEEIAEECKTVSDPNE